MWYSKILFKIGYNCDIPFPHVLAHPPVMQTTNHKRGSVNKTLYLILEISVKSPCLWASFHPPLSPLLVVSVK
jgi:hypothetical protein